MRNFRFICSCNYINVKHMLIRFIVSNFLSFFEETEFNMLAAKSLKSHKEHVYSVKKDLNVLKASAIYGANGAGKSNLIRAIDSLQILVNSGKIPARAGKVKNKLAKDADKMPISYEIEFSIKNKVYTYGVIFDSGLCLEEWLYQTGIKNAKKIFERKYSEEKKHPVITMNEKFLMTKESKMLISLMEDNLLQNDELLISKNKNLKIDEIGDVCEWFKKYLCIIYPNYRPISLATNINNEFKCFSEKLLHSFDLGIDSLALKNEDFDTFFKREKMPENEDIDDIKKDIDEKKFVIFRGKGRSVSATKEEGKYVIKSLITNRTISGKEVAFELNEESDGTQRLLDFVPMINSMLKKERTYVVDELDRSLHPSLLHTLVKKIMDDDDIKGQLIFTTHEAGLLNCKIFRADEIWFAEKDKEVQSTHLYTLNDFKPRNDLDIEKGYLNGRFGAIPFLSKLEDLNWEYNGI